MSDAAGVRADLPLVLANAPRSEVFLRQQAQDMITAAATTQFSK
jgi:hypothetical protein